MNRKIQLVAAFAAAMATSTHALAQQAPPDPAILQRAIVALQAQRNQAMDMAAGQQARADGLADELAKAQVRIKELEPKPAAPAHEKK